MTTLNRAKALQDRTKHFALRVIQASTRVPKTEAGRVLTRQFLRSGTSLAANYRAACRAQSAADLFQNQHRSGRDGRDPVLARTAFGVTLVKAAVLQPLMSECEELLKIFSKSLATAKSNR